MTMSRILFTALLTCVCVSGAWGQDVCSGCPWGEYVSTFSSSPAPLPSETISLTVPRGTMLQVALDKEVRVKRVGQPLHGRLVEPVYAFDREVAPVGSEVLGRIIEIEGVSGKKRFLAALDANFTPARKIQVEFDEIVLPDGRRIPMQSTVTQGSGGTIQLITTADKEKKRTIKDAATERMKEAVREAKRKWQSAMKQVKEPGKMHRLGRFAVAQLPVHPQYLEAGTVYFAELKEPLDFGSASLTARTAGTQEGPPPPCSLLAHAQLVTPLSSATTQKDAPVEAVLTQALFSSDQLLFPQGTRLKGSVAQVRPARRLGRNGTLRMVFNELVLPDGVRQQVDANLEGIQAGESQQVKLDREGGTQATSPKTRYLMTGVAVGLAVVSYEDKDLEDGVTDTRGNASQGAAGGAAAFKLIGIVVGAFARSRPLALGMGVYGAGRSAYSNFLARGRDVVFPKGTTMEIGFWPTRNSCDPAKPN